MNSKQSKTSNQLSLALDFEPEIPEIAPSLIDTRREKVVVMNPIRDESPTFRERVVNDLLRYRVMIAD